MRFISLCFLLLFLFTDAEAQKKLQFRGQLSTFANYSFGQDGFILGGQYIPEASYGIAIDSTKTLNIEAAATISGVTFIGDELAADGQIRPYRLWLRYMTNQFELRFGLQKIDFGSASLLRPLQWFNQIDPRDPLQLTTGVYSVLGRYYFLNNANIWLWALYGNKDPKGIDILSSNWKRPEVGGRFQHPVPKGEVALSYHYRTAKFEGYLGDAFEFDPISVEINVPEHRLGLDGKWDVGIGLWTEAAYIYKGSQASFSPFVAKHQYLLNVGADYTFGIGNGLNVVMEHLWTKFQDASEHYDNPSRHVTATTLNYPLGFFDNINTVLYYDWTSKDFTSFVNYEHQFPKLTAYVMFYYNPTTVQTIQQNDLVTSQYLGKGIRLMFVLNH